jgi:hypothetical protein
MLKDTLVFDSEEEYRLTGTETRPKEIVAVAIERAAMAACGGWRVEGRDSVLGCATKQRSVFFSTLQRDAWGRKR